MDGSEYLGAERNSQVALLPNDRRLLERCLANEPRSWEEFVDRFTGLVLHVVDHTASGQSMGLTLQDREDLVAEVFMAIIANDFRVLRQFRGESSLATYLTVISRRVIMRALIHRESEAVTTGTLHEMRRASPATVASLAEKRISDRDELERIMGRLDGPEADVVRLYHLEGKSYREISVQTGVPENSIGPTLSRARTKLKQANSDSAVR